MKVRENQILTDTRRVLRELLTFQPFKQNANNKEIIMYYFRFFTGLGMSIVFGLVVVVAFMCCINPDGSSITGIQLLLITACCVVGGGLSLELCIEASHDIDEREKRQ